MKLVYIAGPYRARTRWAEEQNVRRAEDAGREVAKMGAYPVIPHANTRPYFGDEQPASFWLEGTMELLQRCDAVLLLDKWERSEGARRENDEAKARGIPVFEVIEVLERWLMEG